MKHFFTILSHEVRMLLVNPATYVAAVIFLSLMGFVFTDILETFSRAAQDTSPADVFFKQFYLPVLFIVPLLTMKCLAEERRLGTMETLLTTPVTTTEVVVGKYGAAYVLYMGLWAATGGFFWILKAFAGDSRLLDPGPMIGGYLFIAVSGLLFVAIGVLASAVCRTQAVAGILCFAMLFALIFGGSYLGAATWLRGDIMHPVKSAVDYAQVLQHYEDFTRGVVDFRQLLFYFSSTVLALLFSILAVEAKLLHN
ncbi:MAG: ABC transporter permease subunit [Verrucomicrobiota bacterium]|jgi:ABC-2 type transport system permease protein|nr:MAG: ABC transporter permease subunit [Verrucomicrobiota bacterium]